jgi:PP-loop superfamily ATP-utilizing enzyme
MRKFLENGTSFRIAEAIKQVGYAHVTLDLLGYRRGSLNEKSAFRSA